MSNTNVIEATLSNGSVLPLRQYESSFGNECYGTLSIKKDGSRYFTKYGVNVSSKVVGDHTQIESVKVLGKTFQVVTDTDDEGVTRLRATGRVKVNGKEKTFSLRITVKQDGTNYNVSSSINGERGKGTGGPITDEI